MAACRIFSFRIPEELRARWAAMGTTGRMGKVECLHFHYPVHGPLWTPTFQHTVCVICDGQWVILPDGTWVDITPRFHEDDEEGYDDGNNS